MNQTSMVADIASAIAEVSDGDHTSNASMSCGGQTIGYFLLAVVILSIASHIR